MVYCVGNVIENPPCHTIRRVAADHLICDFTNPINRIFDSDGMCGSLHHRNVIDIIAKDHYPLGSYLIGNTLHC